MRLDEDKEMECKTTPDWAYPIPFVVPNKRDLTGTRVYYGKNEHDGDYTRVTAEIKRVLLGFDAAFFEGGFNAQHDWAVVELKLSFWKSNAQILNIITIKCLNVEFHDQEMRSFKFS